MSSVINVLIIDHNAQDAQHLADLLASCETCKFEVKSVSTIEEGLLHVENGKFDVLLLDLSMPNSHGLETFKSVKSKTDAIPILVLTGLDDHTVAVEAVKLGAQDYLVKGELKTTWLSRAVLYAIDRFAASQEIKTLNEELVKARDEALAAARFKSEFLANMSHEIRTPMNAVIGMSDLLRRTSLNVEQSKFVEVIKTAGQALLNVVNDILLFSKMEAGRFPLDNAELDIFDVVESAAELLAGQAEEKGIALITFIEPTVPRRVVADPVRLRQILLNLGSNAVKFTDKGYVVISVMHEGAQADHLKFAIEDSGQGMAPDMMQRLFKPFWQGREKAVTTNGGTGLGLAISKLMVEMMGGQIGVNSTEGKGSTFWFTLPLLENVGQFDFVPNPTGRLIAVNFSYRELEHLRNILTHYGMSFGSAATAKEAVREVERSRDNGSVYDFALINVGRVNVTNDTISGDLAPLVNQLELFGILVTGFDQSALGELAVQSGFSAYLSRPLRQSQLLQCLHDLSNGEKVSTINRSIQRQTSDLCLDPKLKVLIVEDNPINQEVANLQLKKLGLTSTVCANGQEAVDLVEQYHYDVILMDCQMPVMNGFEATKQIRALNEKTQQRPIIIAMTANAMEGDREECLAIGMDEYVAKPITIDGLKKLLCTLLPDRLVEFQTGEIHFQLERSSRTASIIKSEAALARAAQTRKSIDTEMLTANFGWESACRLLRMFVDGTPAILEKLEVGLQNEDLSVTKASSHELKGYCSTISMHDMAALSKQLGDAARSGAWSEARSLYTQLNTSFQEARKEIDAMTMTKTPTHS